MTLMDGKRIINEQLSTRVQLLQFISSILHCYCNILSHNYYMGNSPGDFAWRVPKTLVSVDNVVAWYRPQIAVGHFHPQPKLSQHLLQCKLPTQSGRSSWCNFLKAWKPYITFSKFGKFNFKKFKNKRYLSYFGTLKE